MKSIVRYFFALALGAAVLVQPNGALGLAPRSEDFNKAKPALSYFEAKKIIEARYQTSLKGEEPQISPLSGGYNVLDQPFLVRTNTLKAAIKVENADLSKATLSATAAKTLAEQRIAGAVDVIPNDDRHYVTSQYGKNYVVYRFSDAGKEVPKSRAKPREWRGLMKAMTQVHATLRNLPKPLDIQPSSETPMAYLHRKEYSRFGENILRKPESARTRSERLYLSFYQSVILPQLDILEKSLSPEIYERLPSQVIHHDYKFGNVRFDDNGDVATLFDFSNVCWAPRIEEFQGPILYDGAATYSKEDLLRAVVLYNRHASHPLSDEEIRKIPEIIRGTYLEWVRAWFWNFSPQFDLDKHDEAYERISEEIQAFLRFTKDFPETSGESFLREVKTALAKPESWQNSFVEKWNASLYSHLADLLDTKAETKAEQIAKAQVLLPGGEKKPLLTWLQEVMPENAAAVLHGSFLHASNYDDLDIKIVVFGEDFRSKPLVKEGKIKVQMPAAEGKTKEIAIEARIVGQHSQRSHDKFLLATESEEGIVIAGKDRNLYPGETIVFLQAEELISQSIAYGRAGIGRKAKNRLMDGVLLLSTIMDSEELVDMARQLCTLDSMDSASFYAMWNDITAKLTNDIRSSPKRPSFLHYEKEIRDLINETRALLADPSEPLDRSVFRIYQIARMLMMWGEESLLNAVVDTESRCELMKETILRFLEIAEKFHPEQSLETPKALTDMAA